MERGIIKRDELPKLLTSVGEDWKVLAPVQRDGDTTLSEFAQGDELDLSYANFKLSPKDLFFPQTELLAASEDGPPREVPPPDQGVFVFGLRPCDARGFLFLDKVFERDDLKDPYYLRRRQSTVIASLACQDPVPTCFCTSLGGSPVSPDGSDILVFDLGDRLLFDACTDKGKSFLASHSGLFGEPAEADLAARDEQAAAAEKVQPVDASEITEKLQKLFLLLSS